MSKRSQHSDHLSREKMLKYLKGECSSSEMHLIERHLLSCSFCGEAMEGMENTSISDIEDGLFKLDEKLKKRLEKGKRKSPVRLWRVAAIVLLIIGAGYFINTLLFQKTQNIELSERKPSSAEATEDEVKEDSSSAKATEDDKEVKGAKGVEGVEGVEGVKKNEEVKREPSYAKASEDDKGNAGGANSSADLDSFDLEYARVEPAIAEAAEGKNEDAETSEMEVTSEEIEIVAYESPLIDKDGGAVEEVNTGEVAREEVVVTATQAPAGKSRAQASKAEKRSDSGRKITGVVTSEDTQESLPYVTVVNKDKETGTVTDMDGNYEIDAEPGDNIQISYIGFEAQEIELGEEDEVNVSMRSGVDLDEYVVTTSKSDSKKSKAKPLMGDSGYKKYLEENMKYPAEAKEAGIKGKVELEFTIDEFGLAKDFTVLKGLGYGCDEEAIRLVREGPIWSTAMENGVSVEGRVKLRVSFK